MKYQPMNPNGTKQTTKRIRRDVIKNNVLDTYRREYEPGKFTNDLVLNGELYSPAIGDKIIFEIRTRAEVYLAKLGA